MHPLTNPWKHQKTLRFSGGRERVHWGKNGLMWTSCLGIARWFDEAYNIVKFWTLSEINKSEYPAQTNPKVAILGSYIYLLISASFITAK